jgi:hypothetical protein
VTNGRSRAPRANPNSLPSCATSSKRAMRRSPAMLKSVKEVEVDDIAWRQDGWTWCRSRRAWPADLFQAHLGQAGLGGLIDEKPSAISRALRSQNVCCSFFSLEKLKIAQLDAVLQKDSFCLKDVLRWRMPHSGSAANTNRRQEKRWMCAQSR